jgi:hypothetical protein
MLAEFPSIYTGRTAAAASRTHACGLSGLYCNRSRPLRGLVIIEANVTAPGRRGGTRALYRRADAVHPMRQRAGVPLTRSPAQRPLPSPAPPLAALSPLRRSPARHAQPIATFTRSPPPSALPLPAPSPRSALRLHYLDGPMVVAVVAVDVVQLAVYEVVSVVAVRHRLVAAVRPVPMAVFVTVVEARGALRGVARVDLDAMLVNVVLVRVVQATVVQVVGVSVVAHGSVAAVGAMLVVMAFVDPVILCHRCCSSF